MKCENCGTENLEGASKCKNCKQSFLNPNKDMEATTNKEEVENHDNQQLIKEITSATDCPNCGTKITEEFSFCPNCGKRLENHSITVKDNGNANIYIIVWLICVFFGNILPRLLSDSNLPIGSISFLGFITSLIVAVAAKIKYPHNKIIKAIFWITICYFILTIAFMAYILFICYGCLSNAGPAFG